MASSSNSEETAQLLQNDSNDSHDTIPHSEPEAQPTRWGKLWLNNRGIFYILLSEVFGSSMDAIVRFLQQGDHRMHPFQVIFARMGMTFLLSSIYMWWTKVPDFPLGNPKVRGFLVLRALFGFSGLFCLYYSVHYLPLAEATVFRFLVPILTAFACSILLDLPFTRKEFLAGIVALIGVIIIAHPESIFGSDVDSDSIKPQKAGEADHVTPAQRLLAIGVSLLGVCFAPLAYTMIRVIGDRAHALISVNYFGFFGTVFSATMLLVVPGMSFTMPQGVREWVLLVSLGTLGFILQFLLTSGLQIDKSSRATSMMYAQVIFALAFDWGIWGVLPQGWSWVGGGIVIASTLWSALQKPNLGTTQGKREEVVDEESALLGAETGGVEEVVRRASIVSSG